MKITARLSDDRGSPMRAATRAGAVALLLAALLVPLPAIAAPGDDAVPFLDDQDDGSPVPVRAPAIAALPIRPPRTTPPDSTARVEEAPSAPSPDFVPAAATAPRAPPLS